MKVTVDTNVLVRALVEDDADQAAVAKRLLSQATLIAIPLAVFCELAWVLRSRYRYSVEDIGAAIAGIMEIATVVANVPAVQAGLMVLRAGGDFADGAAAAEGQAMGGEVFASFDQTALKLWERHGGQAAEPASLLSRN